MASMYNERFVRLVTDPTPFDPGRLDVWPAEVLREAEEERIS